MDLLIQDPSSKRNHTIDGLRDRIPSLHVVSVHPCGAYISTLFFSFSRLNNIPLCGYCTFVYPSVGISLGYFHIVTIMNNTVVQTCVQAFMEDYGFSFFRYIPRSGFTDYLVTCLNLWGTSLLVCAMAAPFSILTTN